MSAETISIMAHTENSGKGGVSSNSQSTYTTLNSLVAGDIIGSIKAMFSALTDVLQKTLTSMGPNCMKTPNVKWSRSIRWQRQLLRWLHRIKLINRLQGALTTQKILIIKILGKIMKWMMDGIGSLSMKRIVVLQ